MGIIQLLPVWCRVPQGPRRRGVLTSTIIMMDYSEQRPHYHNLQGPLALCQVDVNRFLRTKELVIIYVGGIDCSSAKLSYPLPQQSKDTTPLVHNCHGNQGNKQRGTAKKQQDPSFFFISYPSCTYLPVPIIIITPSSVAWALTMYIHGI